MNDLKSDLFPKLGCLRGDAARKGEEPGPRGRRVHWGAGGAPLVFGEYSGGAPVSRFFYSVLLITHRTWMVYFIHEREE